MAMKTSTVCFSTNVTQCALKPLMFWHMGQGPGHLWGDAPQRRFVIYLQLLGRLCAAQLLARVQPRRLLMQACACGGLRASGGLLACVRQTCIGRAAVGCLLSQRAAAGSCGCKDQARRPASSRCDSIALSSLHPYYCLGHDV